MKDEFRFVRSSDLDFEEMVVQIECIKKMFSMWILQDRGVKNLELWLYCSDDGEIPARFDIDALIYALNRGKSIAYDMKNPEDNFQSITLYPKIEILEASDVNASKLHIVLAEGTFCTAFKNEFSQIIIEFSVYPLVEECWKMSLDDFYEVLNKVLKHFQD